MEALLVTKLVFAACDQASLQKSQEQNSMQGVSDQGVSSIVTAAAAAVLDDNTISVNSVWW